MLVARLRSVNFTLLLSMDRAVLYRLVHSPVWGLPALEAK